MAVAFLPIYGTNGRFRGGVRGAVAPLPLSVISRNTYINILEHANSWIKCHFLYITKYNNLNVASTIPLLQYTPLRLAPFKETCKLRLYFSNLVLDMILVVYKIKQPIAFGSYAYILPA